MRRAASVSAALHAMVFIAVALWMAQPPVPPAAPEGGVRVELVMIEQRGAGPPAAAPIQPPNPPASVPATPSTEPPPAERAQGELAPAPARALPLPPAPPPRPVGAPKPTPGHPAPSPSEPVTAAGSDLRVNLGGTDSPTDAVAQGDAVLPARLDARGRNRDPVYPPEAVRRGEQGVVRLLVHVSAEGRASGVEITASSGFLLLDRAAREAVAAWRFLPAVRDGRPIRADMPLLIRFELNGSQE